MMALLSLHVLPQLVTFYHNLLRSTTTCYDLPQLVRSTITCYDLPQLVRSTTTCYVLPQLVTILDPLTIYITGQLFAKTETPQKYILYSTLRRMLTMNSPLMTFYLSERVTLLHNILITFRIGKIDTEADVQQAFL